LPITIQQANNTLQEHGNKAMQKIYEFMAGSASLLSILTWQNPRDEPLSLHQLRKGTSQSDSKLHDLFDTTLACKMKNALKK